MPNYDQYIIQTSIILFKWVLLRFTKEIFTKHSDTYIHIRHHPNRISIFVCSMNRMKRNSKNPIEINIQWTFMLTAFLGSITIQFICKFIHSTFHKYLLMYLLGLQFFICNTLNKYTWKLELQMAIQFNRSLIKFLWISIFNLFLFRMKVRLLSNEKPRNPILYCSMQ